MPTDLSAVLRLRDRAIFSARHFGHTRDTIILSYEYPIR